MKDRRKSAIELILLTYIIYYFTGAKIWLIIGAVLGVIGAYLPKLVEYILWVEQLIFVKVIGAVVSRIILAVVYYLILVPLALFRRMMGGNLFLLKREDRESYWIDREKSFDPKELEKQF